MASAIENAGAVFAAVGEAEGLAWQAMLDGRVRYSHRLGWAERDLLEKWLFYARTTRLSHPQPEAVELARKMLRTTIKTFRRLNVAETRGIDTSVPGWRGGRAA